MNFRDTNVTIGGVVAALPEAKAIFSDFGIDYCCGGNRLLSDVIHQQNLNESAILNRLEQAQNERQEQYREANDFTTMTPTVLTNYIEDKHHNYLREMLPITSELLGTILRVHGKNHPELFEVYRLFGTLRTDLEQHLLKEETMLFPALSQTDPDRNEVIRITTDIIHEHVAAGAILEELRQVTKDYSLPNDACGTYHKAYEMLKDMEDDLHQHIHLENNILLKEYDLRGNQ